MKHHQHDKCGVCKIPAFERNNFFYGKLMTVRDFCDEQRYFNEKRWLLNRMISGWGVVCGLDVTVDTESGATSRLAVSPGLALDCCGREILVCETRWLKVPEDIFPDGGVQLSQEIDLVLCLEYHECKTEALNLPPTACDAKERGEFNRVRDSFKLRIRRASEVDLPAIYGKYCPWMDIKIRAKRYFQISAELLNVLEEEYTGIYAALEDLIDVKYEDKKTFRQDVRQRLAEREIGDIDAALAAVLDGAEITFPEHCAAEYDSLHQYLVRHQNRGCPECAAHGCVVLATFRYHATNGIQLDRFDKVKHRRLVYNNAMLYDMLHCLHGDLPHIIGINWYHLHGRHNVQWEEFAELMEDGLKVCFDKEMDPSTFNAFSFQVAVINQDPDTGYLLKRYIPLNKAETMTQDPIREFVFRAPDRWNKEELKSGYSKIRQQGAQIEIVIRGSLILEDVPEENGAPARTPKALDADFIDGRFPTGNGSQGGDFVSWFRVKPKQKKDDEA